MEELRFREICGVFIFEYLRRPRLCSRKRAEELARLIERVCPLLRAGVYATRPEIAWVGSRAGEDDSEPVEPGDIILARGGVFLVTSPESVRVMSEACRDFAGFLSRQDGCETLGCVLRDELDCLRPSDREAFTRAAGLYVPVRDMELLSERIKRCRN